MTSADQAKNLLLLLATFAIAVCGLVYELLVGTVSSYLLGDSVYQFSIVIGLFMTAMGLGSFLSRYVAAELAPTFIGVQVALGLIGGLTPLLLFQAFAQFDNYGPFLFLLCAATGTLVGLEIPLVVRMLERVRRLKINISNVLTVDYVGALAAALLFPLVLVPHLGLLRTGLLFGLLNLAVAGLALWVFRREHPRPGRQLALIGSASTLLLAVFLLAPQATRWFEDRLFQDEIVYAETSPYQRILLTRDGERLRLFLDGALQFDSLDEYRYHEALVHPALSLARQRGRVLILGGGDGLALRELLRFPGVHRVDLVDLDPAVTDLFQSNPLLTGLNQGALSDPRVRVINQDAWKFLEHSAQLYDLILIDLPDPRNLSLSRLYSQSFYRLAARRLAADGLLATQATSPLYAREAYWSIHDSIASELHTRAYHAYVPSFGDWGFVLAAHRPIDWARAQPLAEARFVTADTLAAMPQFPPDSARLTVRPNTLMEHALVGYYRQGWSKWYD